MSECQCIPLPNQSFASVLAFYPDYRFGVIAIAVSVLLVLTAQVKAVHVALIAAG